MCNLEELFHDDLETKFIHHDIQIKSKCLDLILHSSKFINIFRNPKLKIPYKFDFRLGLIDFEKNYSNIISKYGYVLILFLKDLYSN